MTQRKMNVRGVIVEVEDSTPNSWLKLSNNANFTHNPGENEEVFDTTDFDSDGAYEQEIMQRGASLTMEGSYMQDDLTGALPAARARLEELTGEDAVGADSLGRIRFRYGPQDPKWKIWTCTFSPGERGGGTNEKLSWSVTVTKSGKTSYEDVA